MKILCSQCFETVTLGEGGQALCVSCGAQFDLKRKATLFRARLEGGYVKDGMTKEEAIKNIKEGKILLYEYIAAQGGPWITVYDSPFSCYAPIKGKKAGKARASALIYEKNKAARITTVSLGALLAVSAGVNIFLLWLMLVMKQRMGELVALITGG